MYTQKTKYAILAMKRLAKEYGKGTLLIGQIAESEKIPKRFLESILLELKKYGFLGSKLGKAGGYFLLKRPENISLLEIIKIFEGTVALLQCTSEDQHLPCEHCEDEVLCSTRFIFKDIQEYTLNKLAGTTLASLISGVSSTN